ncbi:MAG: sortase [Chloroflexi bacterium]|nr:sortase [Chloroflexota bacterium]
MRRIAAALPRRGLGAFLLAMGVPLLLAGSGYFLYGFKARADLDRLVYQPTLEAPTESAPSAQVTEGDGLASEPTLESIAAPEKTAPDTLGAAPRPAGPLLGPGAADHPLYPGGYIAVKDWADPLAAQSPGPEQQQQQQLIQGFRPIAPWETARQGSLSPPSRILIPSIEVDSATKELEILDLGNSLAYETPKWVVGHIPGTSNPGEQGNGWYFGHLESPIKDEGNVFLRLPEVPDLLRKGEEVYVIAQNLDQQYLYRVTKTDVLRAEDTALYPSDRPVITLVTCVPKLYYTHRLLVTAELVGVKALANS